jgi:acyl-CoA thioesterase FadM
MGDLVGRREVGALTAGHVIGVRELVTTYVTEAHPGEQLYAGCRILGRSRRSYLFDEVLATADRVVSRMRVLECVISGGRAIEIPAGFWAAVEVVEGRTMPIRELPIGRTPWEEI